MDNAKGCLQLKFKLSVANLITIENAEKTIKHQIFGCCTNLYQEIKIPLKCRRQCRVLIAFVCLTTSRSAILFSILLPKSSGTHSFASFNNN
jgi:hypothetical protein